MDATNILLPSISTRLNDRDDAMDLASFMFNKKRIIYLFCDIDERSVQAVILQICALAGKSNEDIKLVINSGGGSVDDGLALYNVMQNCGCDVATIAMGKAASMGAFLLVCGTKGKRYVLEDTRIMLHQPSLQNFSANATDMGIFWDEMSQKKARIAQLLAQKTGQSIKKITQDCERDFWLSATEMIAYGGADHIVTGENIGGLLL